MMNQRRLFLLLSIFAVVFTCGTLATRAFAEDWFFTGSAVRTKSIGPFTAKVYSIRHDIKGHPAKSKQAVIDADMDKRFTWKMLRDVDKEKIQKALREAYAMNGYTDAGKIGTFIAAFNKDEVKEDSAVVITYSTANKTTSIWVANGGSASVLGEDFMKATWSIWLGKIDQASMGDDLIAKL